MDHYGRGGIGGMVARNDARSMVEQFAAGRRAIGYRCGIGIPAEYHHHVLLFEFDGGLGLHGACGIYDG